jgi:hypothetical protein
VVLSSFSATAHEEGKVLLEWRTGYEASNLGFNIYREEGGQRIQINSELIKGSALMTGAETRTAGFSYAWWDISAIADVGGSLTLEDRPSASRIEANNSSASAHRSAVGDQRSVFSPSSPLSAPRYYLEDLDLNGTKTLHGPVTPVFSNNPSPQQARSMLLSQINKQGAGGRAQGAGNKSQEAELRPRPGGKAEQKTLRS